MESYLSSESKNKLAEIVNYIKSSHEYINCIHLKEQISKDKLLMEEIDAVKNLQMKYVRSNYDKSIKEMLDELESKLLNNMLYTEYNYYLDKVNDMINLVKDELNDYFSSVVNAEF